MTFTLPPMDPQRLNGSWTTTPPASCPRSSRMASGSRLGSSGGGRDRSLVIVLAKRLGDSAVALHLHQQRQCKSGQRKPDKARPLKCSFGKLIREMNCLSQFFPGVEHARNFEV